MNGGVGVESLKSITQVVSDFMSVSWYKGSTSTLKMCQSTEQDLTKKTVRLGVILSSVGGSDMLVFHVWMWWQHQKNIAMAYISSHLYWSSSMAGSGRYM